MTCPRCGSPVGDEQAACPQCGLATQPLPPQPAPAPAAAWGPMPVWTGGLRPVRPLATALTLCLAGVIVSDVLAIGTAVHRRSLFQRILDGGDFTQREAELSDALYFGVGFLQLAVYVATIVLWLIWFYRARCNAEFYGFELRHSKGWAIGSWFVPILHWFRPKAITDDIAAVSNPDLDSSHRRLAQLPKRGLITVWWVVWVVSWVGGRWLFGQYRDADQPEDEPGLMLTEIVVTLVDIASAVLAILVVRLITSRQERKNQLLAEQAGWAPAPAPTV